MNAAPGPFKRSCRPSARAASTRLPDGTRELAITITFEMVSRICAWMVANPEAIRLDATSWNCRVAPKRLGNGVGGSVRRLRARITPGRSRPESHFRRIPHLTRQSRKWELAGRPNVRQGVGDGSPKPHVSNGVRPRSTCLSGSSMRMRSAATWLRNSSSLPLLRKTGSAPLGLSCAALAGSCSSRSTCRYAHGQSPSHTATTRGSIGQPCESRARIQNGGSRPGGARRVSC